MNITIALCQMMGIVFVVLGLSMLVSRKGITSLVEETTRNEGLLWSWGFVAVIMGAALIAFNGFMLGSGLQLLIVVIGWVALLKGVLILFFPNATVSLYKKWNVRGVFVWSGIIALIIGLFFLYAGFM
jgi:hypothetical protein